MATAGERQRRLNVIKVGDYVKFGAPTGSTGKAVSEHGSMLYVEWNYGKDSRGEAIKATSGFCRKSGGYRDDTLQLIKITQEEYEAVANRKAWEK